MQRYLLRVAAFSLLLPGWSGLLHMTLPDDDAKQRQCAAPVHGGGHSADENWQAEEAGGEDLSDTSGPPRVSKRDGSKGLHHLEGPARVRRAVKRDGATLPCVRTPYVQEAAGSSSSSLS